MSQPNQFDRIRQGILEAQEKLRADLETLNRLEKTYTAESSPMVAAKKDEPDKTLFPFDTVPGSLVDSVRESLRKRPDIEQWTVRRAYEAVRDDGFKFSRDTEQGAVNAVSTVLSKLEKKGFLRLVRKKVGRYPAIYMVNKSEDWRSVSEIQQEAAEADS